MSKITKQTGPKTKIGKETSSQNAITHGATSKQFLSPQEQKSYAKHLQGLKQSFLVRNYLMDLQIDRLARLHVQSERIQKIIEAQFLKAQKTSTVAEKLRQELEIEGLQSLRLIETGQLIVDQYAKEQVIELDNFQPFVYWYILTLQNQDLTSDDLIDRAPKLAIFLYQLAQSEHQSINQTLDRLIQEKPQKAKEFKEKLVSIYQSMIDIEDTAISNEMREEIELISPNLLRQFVAWYMQGFNYQIMSAAKIRKYEELLPIYQQANLPPSDILDRLSRYQTSCERQISTVTGELLHMQKQIC